VSSYVLVYTYAAPTFTVSFSPAEYRVDENSGLVQPVLVLSNSSSSIITIHVFTTEGSATGETHTCTLHC